MPRTKATKKTNASTSNTEKAITEGCLRQMDEEFELYLNRFREIVKTTEESVDALLKEERISVPSRLGNKTLGELKAGVSDCTTVVDITSSMSSTSSIKSVLHKSRTLRRSLSEIHDEGYLTAGSNTSTEGRTTRRSRKQTNLRESRSLSRSKLAYKTPANKSARLQNFGTITPKMKPNTPQLVLRRPKIGEVAVSMQGSPLLVSGVVTDETPNVNIPLGDGRTISIQPRRGLRPSLLPALDLHTRKQIETLRDNLNKMCALAAQQSRL